MDNEYPSVQMVSPLGVDSHHIDLKEAQNEINKHPNRKII